MQFEGLNDKAHELRVNDWIGPDGKPMDNPLRLADMGDGYKIIYAFQHWCPGCHSRGFPTMRILYDALKDKNVGFAAIQTVFEGGDVNTIDKLRSNQMQYGLKIPFGHDTPRDGERYPSFMEDYRSAGTPWFTVIDPKGIVVFADFRLDASRFLDALGADDVEMVRA